MVPATLVRAMSRELVLHSKHFDARVERGLSQLTLWLSGSADLGVQTPFASLVLDVDAEAVRLRVNEVILEIQKLVFMNSTCFKHLCSWLRRVGARMPHERYRFRLLSSSKQHWQRRSLYALRGFAPELVEIDVRDD